MFRCDSRVSKKVGVEISDDELFTGNHNHYFLPLCDAGACLTKVASGGNKSKDIVKTETLLPDLFVESKLLKRANAENVAMVMTSSYIG